MNRGVWLAGAVLLAVASSASAEQAARPAGTKVVAAADKATEKGGDKDKKDAQTTPPKRVKRGLKKDPEPTGPSKEVRSAVRRTRSVYMYAIEACSRPGGSCDAALRDDAEQRFLEACGACAPSVKCEAERDAIRGGTSRSAAFDICAPAPATSAR